MSFFLSCKAICHIDDKALYKCLCYVEVRGGGGGASTLFSFLKSLVKITICGQGIFLHYMFSLLADKQANNNLMAIHGQGAFTPPPPRGAAPFHIHSNL